MKYPNKEAQCMNRSNTKPSGFPVGGVLTLQQLQQFLGIPSPQVMISCGKHCGIARKHRSILLSEAAGFEQTQRFI